MRICGRFQVTKTNTHMGYVMFNESMNEKNGGSKEGMHEYVLKYTKLTNNLAILKPSNEIFERWYLPLKIKYDISRLL